MIIQFSRRPYILIQILYILLIIIFLELWVAIAIARRNFK